MRLREGVKIPLIKTRDIFGRSLDFNELEGGKTYIGFLRNIDCLFCNQRFNRLLKNANLLKNNGIRVILFVQNDPELVKDVLLQDKELPFILIPDPRMKFYKKFGVGGSVLGMIASLFRVGKLRNGLKEGNSFKIFQRGKLNLMPADFLVKENLVIEKAHYGKNTGDHLSIEEMIRFAAA